MTDFSPVSYELMHDVLINKDALEKIKSKSKSYDRFKKAMSYCIAMAKNHRIKVTDEDIRGAAVLITSKLDD